MLHSHSTATAPAPGFRGRSISARGAALAAVVAALLAALFPLAAAPGPRFEQDVVPILGRYCFHCHGEAVKMGDLDLRTPASMLKGGSKGPALAPGSPERSIFYQRIADKSMPMGPAKLSDAEQRVIHEWISGGAAAASPHPAGESGSGARIHWAFRPPERPPVPPVRSAGQVRTAVDRFLLSRLESRGIQPAPPADGATLLRRAYLNLIGLPPSLEEQETFLADRSPDAYEKVVEALLARPQYGERWARRWLDVVRYAESNGYERDGVKPHAWRYRDYVIDAFNRDKPFDRFLTEQLAGDEIEGSNDETQIATTFLRLGTWDDEPAEPMLDRYDQLDDVLGVTATAFLGLTLRCARCHDHKFEPFPQKDYYRLLAVFEPLKRPQDDRKDLDRLAGTDAELSAYRQAIAVADAQVSQIQRQIDDSRKAILKRLFENKNKTGAQGDLAWLEHAETVLAFQTEPAKRNKEQKALVESFNARLDREIASAGSAEENSRFEAWKKEIAAVNAARPKEPPRAYVWYEEGPRAPATYLLQRGDPAAPGEEVRPGVPSILGPASLEPPAASRRSTGRRLWLARWMTRPDHPLVARVIVNRLWQWHFGEGLVASENDFGLMGQRPSHPELLDYLATELIRSGWSLKHIQRLIVNSGAFRLSSAWNEQAGKLDPENALLWRWKPRRLEAEVIRDAALAVGSRLNLEMGGPSIFPPLPRAVLEGQSRPGEGWGQSDEKQAARRSIYIFVKRSLAVPELEVLDTPDTSSSCEQRPVSTTGPQALAFLNGESTHQQARAFARRVERLAGLEPAAQASTAFRLALARPPKPAELKAALEFLSLQQRQIDRDSRAQGAPPARAFLEAFCLVLLNSNEFFYLN